MVIIDAGAGTLDREVGGDELRRRDATDLDLSGNREGTGRELFGAMRAGVGDAESGASVLFERG